MKLLVVSGPSGVGKTTVCRHLLEGDSIERVITATTRAPRGKEQADVDYVFLSNEEFDAWIEQGRFLEWATVHGQRYGSPRAHAESILGSSNWNCCSFDTNRKHGTSPVRCQFLRDQPARTH